MALLLPVLISRTAGYAIRMSGGVGGGGREVTPYPDSVPDVSDATLPIKA